MSQLSTYVNCPEIQTAYDRMFMECDPQLTLEPLVLTDFLQSPENTNNVLSMRVAPGNGKIREVDMLYSPRLPESEVLVGEGRELCESPNTIGETTARYTLEDTDYYLTSVQINPRELTRRCEDNAIFFARKINQLINQLARKRETAMFSQLALLNGNFAAGIPGTIVSKTKNVSTLGADDKFSTDMFTAIGTDARYNSYCSNPIVIGGYAPGQYFREVKAGCCAADGRNVFTLAEQYGMSFLESYRADNAFGASGFMVVDKGAVQMLQYSAYEGELNYLDLGTLQQMSFVDPNTGIKYDIKINIDCNGIFNVFVSSWAKLVGLPNDMYYSDDRLSGVTFVNKYQIVNT